MNSQIQSYLWRLLFILGGILMLIGGPQHPGGTMLEMLQNPVWFKSHAYILAGFTAWTIALWLFRRNGSFIESTDKWLRIGVIVSAIQAIDYIFHTMAYVDAEALAAGGSTPILTIHMWMTVIIYPIYAIGIVGMIWVIQKNRVLGTPWIGWLGILGAAAHGTAGLIVAGLDIEQLRFLFPMLMLLALWHVIVGFMPANRNEVAEISQKEMAVT